MRRLLIFGDMVRAVPSQEKLATIAAALDEVSALDAGIVRHQALVAAFIEAAELAQGIADAEFDARQLELNSPGRDASMALLLALASEIRNSWETGFRSNSDPIRSNRAVSALSALLPDLSRMIHCKRAEGYAHYTLYPEAYLEAGLRLRISGPLRVIGIRSIGVGLSALVATAGNGTAPLSLRPIGHPFQRTVAPGTEITDTLLSDRAASFAIVDEGPGLSGSSFGAVADFLEENGVSRRRIHFFPSHAGDVGPEASEQHRIRWQAAARHVVDFDPLIVRSTNPLHRLESWVADITGPCVAPLEDVSFGRWRTHICRSEPDWPPAHVQHERRKFLLRTQDGEWLLKFAGLGRVGSAKLPRARALYDAGFSPEVAGYRHGFIVQRWVADARPLRGGDIDRSALVNYLGSYLGFRARHFETSDDQGASLPTLMGMARHNTAEVCGASLAQIFDDWIGCLPELERRVRRVETDNRLHGWEWLISANGRLIKTDALDHHAAHDLVGCQDAAWDIAGATVEFDLSSEEQYELRKLVERYSGKPVDRELLGFLLCCYLAFQLGYYEMAADTLGEIPDEAVRMHATARRYRRKLEEYLTGANLDGL
ncbi:MAG: hypothetical protein QOK29_2908 [Rhodospirillaceae bacterium]|jgi:hypothetical protein|nr:hypothetical protein [Rhodospirillaceae bacterium]